MERASAPPSPSAGSGTPGPTGALAAGALAALAAAAVLLTGSLSYALAVQGIVTIWIPSGVMLALVYALDTRAWPAALVGGLIGNLAADLIHVGPAGLVVIGPFANTAETLLAALVLRRLVGRTDLLASERGVAALVLGAAVAANAVTALAGGALLTAWYGSSLAVGWLNWWVGDGLGMIVVAPAMLGAVPLLRRVREHRWRWQPFVEGAALLAVVVAVALYAFDRPAGSGQFMASTYLVFPFLIWMALRLGPGASAAAVCALAGVALWHTALGRGPLVDPGHPALEQAVHVYAFLGLASLSVLVPSAVIAEREAAAEQVRASEERYRALVDTARDAIITVAADGRIRFTNPAVEHILGFEPGALAGRSVVELVPERDRETIRALFRRYADGAERIPWRGIQLTALHREGREIPVEFAFGEWVAEGERFFTGIVRDISERQRLEEELRHAQKLEALGQLTGGVAHEFRNELAVILLNTELALGDTAPDHPRREALEEIRSAAGRSSALTGELLAFGRRKTLQPALLDVDAEVEQAVGTMRPLLGRGIRVETGGAGGPKRVHADASALRQVIVNLMINAKDAMPDGGTLTVRTGGTEVDAALAARLALAAPGRYVTIEVADTGVGMTDATMARIFEPFFTTKTHGTGLGLSTVHGIVKQSGGAVRVTSTPGAGTVFRILFPDAGTAAAGPPPA